MNRERAEEIERLVIYKSLNYMPYDTLDSVSAFHIGRMLGIMQETLNRELDAEVSKDLSEVEE
jgi:hypothetical protein